MPMTKTHNPNFPYIVIVIRIGSSVNNICRVINFLLPYFILKLTKISSIVTLLRALIPVLLPCSKLQYGVFSTKFFPY
uniref:Putative ovule protein n=1 Tax=Solanum chacoense TaxID=4108 RepID=A0A0V0INJ6_SOLCH